MELINVQTRLPEQLEPEAAHAAFLSGTHGIPKGQEVQLVNPKGELVSARSDEVLPALTQGNYSFPSHGQLEEQRLQREYGTDLTSSFRAAAESAARTGSFGLSDKLITTIDPSQKEGLTQREARNPKSAIAGAGLAILGGALVGDEAPLASLFKPLQAVSKVGQAVEGGTAALVGADAAKSLIGKAITKGISKAAGSAVEGLAYEAGHQVSEAVLGDPKEVAEHLVANLGMGALIGGSFGGALGLGEVALPAAFEAAKKASNKFADAVAPKVKDAFVKGSSWVSGIPEETIRKGIDNRALMPTADSAKESVEGLSKTLQGQHDAMSNLAKKTAVSFEADPLVPQSEKMLEHQAASARLDKSLEDVQKKFMYEDKSGKFLVDDGKISRFLSQSNSASGAKNQVVMNEFNEASQNYLKSTDSLYKTLPEKSFDKEGVQELLTKHSDQLAQGIQQAEVAKTFSQLGSGKEENLLGTAAIAGGASHLLGIPGSATAAVAGLYDALKYPGLTIQRLTKIENLANKTAMNIERGSSAIFKVGDKAADALRGPLSAAMVPKIEQEQARQDYREDYEDRVKHIGTLVSNPLGLTDSLAKQTEGIYPHAPKVTGAIQATAVNALQYLNSKIPQPVNSTPLGHPYQPSRAEMAQFNATYDVVNNPVSVLEKIKKGTLTANDVDALKATMPSLYASMQKSLVDKISSQKKSVPYKTKMMLGLFMGQDMDSSTLQPAIAANQQTYGGPSQKPSNQGMPTKTRAKGLDNLGASNRLLTPMQKIAQGTDS